MNIFLSQSIQTQIELEEIADVKRQIISPSTSNPIIGIVQDGLLGAYNLTSPHVRIDWKNAMNIMSYTSIDDFKLLKKNKEYTGQELFSLIVPPKINVSKGGTEIKNGILTKGYLGKDQLGFKKNSVHQLIWDEYGVEATMKFLDDTQRLTNNFNLFNGFTAGIGDAELSSQVEAQIHNILQTKDLKVSHIITENENNPGLLSKDLFERNIFAEVNTIRDDISKLIMNNISPLNNFSIMAKSGARGDATTICQMIGCVGMMAFEGGMMPKRINQRTLPFFFQNDDRGDSRGLVRTSYLFGTTFPEFFYVNVAGRQGLIDSAVKTAESGYIQRKLIKSLEDAIIRYDCTVRSANNGIIQFIYGDTGANTIKQYEYSMKMIEMNDKEIAAKYKIKDEDLSKYNIKASDNEEYYKNILAMRDLIRSTYIKYKMNSITLSSTFMLPVNFPRIVENVRNDETLKSEKEHLDAKYVIAQLNELLSNRLTTLLPMKKSDIDNPKSIKYQDEMIAKTSFKIALHDILAPAKCIYDHKFNKAQFDNVIKLISDSYSKNMVEPGEMVGIIAAQALGEPTSQMTLKSFHTSGIAAISTTTQGVPRMKELMSLSKKIKTPQMIIYLTKEYMGSKEMAKKIASHIKFTMLGHIKDNITVYYDVEPHRKGGFMENDNVVHAYYTHNPNKNSCQSDINNLPWLMRIELNREKMLEKEVTLLDIKSKFCNSWEKRFVDKNIKKEEKYVYDRITQLALLSNTDNDKTPVLHIRFDMTEYSTTLINNFIDQIIEKFKLKGITSIQEISTIDSELTLTFDNPDHAIEKKNQWVIYTQGVNLYDLRYINGIDVYKTICNDVISIYEVFGIEAARATLAREIIIAYERAGVSVNYHHISVLVDLMTKDGYLTSIDRHGMNKSDVDPLSRASFEKTVEQLITAAFFGEVDHMKGVSSRIMAGLVIKGGTGLCDVILDTEMLEKSEFTEDIGQKYQKTFIPVQKSSINEHISKEEDYGIFMPE